MRRCLTALGFRLCANPLARSAAGTRGGRPPTWCRDGDSVGGSRSKSDGWTWRVALASWRTDIGIWMGRIAIMIAGQRPLLSATRSTSTASCVRTLQTARYRVCPRRNAQTIDGCLRNAFFEINGQGSPLTANADTCMYYRHHGWLHATGPSCHGPPLGANHGTCREGQEKVRARPRGPHGDRSTYRNRILACYRWGYSGHRHAAFAPADGYLALFPERFVPGFLSSWSDDY